MEAGSPKSIVFGPLAGWKAGGSPKSWIPLTEDFEGYRLSLFVEEYPYAFVFLDVLCIFVYICYVVGCVA